MGRYRYSTRMGSWISDINLNSAGKFTGKSQLQYSAESGPGYAQIGLNIKYNNNGKLAMRVLLNNQDTTGVFWDKVAW